MSLIFTAFSDSCLDSSEVVLSSNGVPWEIVKLEGQQVGTEIPELNSVKVYSACPLTMRSMEVASPTCLGDSNGFAKIEAKGGFPPYMYAWNTGILDPEINHIQGGDYRVTVIDSRGHRLVKDISVQIPIPVEFDLMIQDSYCEEYPGYIRISSRYRDNLTLTWGDLEFTEDVWLRMGLDPDKYGFTIANSTGCRQDTFAIVKRIYIKIPEIEDTVYLCEGETLEVNPLLSELSVNWMQNGHLQRANSQVFTPVSSGQFELVYDLDGKCVVSKSFQVYIDPTDIRSFKDTVVLAGSILRYRLDSVKDVTWTSDQFDLTCSICEEVEFVTDRTGFLSFSRFNRNGCLVGQTILIEVARSDIYLPNIVTPNGDGLNDRIISDGFDGEITGILLFNAYGSKVRSFPSLDKLNEFIHSRSIPQGTYYYILTVKNRNGKEQNYYNDLNIIYP